MVKCIWGRSFDFCKALAIFGPNASFFSVHKSMMEGPGGEWVVGGIDGMDTDTSSKQSNFVVRVTEGKNLPSTSNITFKLNFWMPSLSDSWISNGVRITSISSGTPIDVEVACTEKSSICAGERSLQKCKVRRSLGR